MKKLLAGILAAAMLATMTACGSKAKITVAKAEDLSGLKIGVQAGTTGESYVQDNIADAKLSSYKSGMDAALDLKNGAIDAIVLDELPSKSIVAQNSDLQLVDINLATEEYAIAVKKGNTELLDSINKTIAAMRADGRYEALVNAFMPASGDADVKIPDVPASEGEKNLKMGTNAAFKPFEYVDGKDIVGFDISMAEYIASDYGAKLEVVDMNFDSLLSALQADSLDFVAAGLSINPERQQQVDFSDPYYSSKQVVIIRK